MVIVWLLEKFVALIILYSVWVWFWTLSLIPQIIIGLIVGLFIYYALTRKPSEAELDEAMRGPTHEEIWRGFMMK